MSQPDAFRLTLTLMDSKFSVDITQDGHIDVDEETLREYFPADQTDTLPEGIIIRFMYEDGDWCICPFLQGQTPDPDSYSTIGQRHQTTWPAQRTRHYIGDRLQIGDLSIHISIKQVEDVAA